MDKGTLDKAIIGTGWTYTTNMFTFTHTDGSLATGKAAWLVAEALIRKFHFKEKLKEEYKVE